MTKPLTSPPSTKITQQHILQALAPLKMKDSQIPKIRVGNQGDGGYVIPNDLSNIAALISIGIGRDVSFDLHFANLGITVFQYDHTVPGPSASHKNFVFNKTGWADSPSNGFTSLPKILEDNSLTTGPDLILKFDVDNAEWDALANLPQHILNRFRIIVCELHKLARINTYEFYKKFSHVTSLLSANHTVVHAHPNNCCKVVLVEGIILPNVMEFTFLRNDRSTFTPSNSPIPSALDFPNVTKHPELILSVFNS